MYAFKVQPFSASMILDKHFGTDNDMTLDPPSSSPKPSSWDCATVPGHKSKAGIRDLVSGGTVIAVIRVRKRHRPSTGIHMDLIHTPENEELEEARQRARDRE